MSPFSIKLKALRESRHVMQKTLAIELGVSTTYLSALEKARKSPPRNKEFFEKLRIYLDLSDGEAKEIIRLAGATVVLGPLAVGASPLQLDLAVNFAERLIWLQPKQIRAIQAILEMTEQRTQLMPV
ncbi:MULTISPECIES: helix-turn-helix domain-containing protein [Herbaspirillum]|jgi:transcriptional regulator with XRE-family HTH domain|uniref:helix-turn-helix domain-containing protein n=1 Tax=Herbaspirillum TaxID=963 RepID=UPI0011D20F67|nr:MULTISPECIES: helix-turn-helix transcriptional regulator [Herbaspirillum]